MPTSHTPDGHDRNAASTKLSPLHALLHTEFTAAFGPANHVLGKDMHWGVRPQPHLPALNVLVNGSAEIPIVWIFDPHNHDNGGVHYEPIYAAEGVTALRDLIERRIAAARGS